MCMRLSPWAQGKIADALCYDTNILVYHQRQESSLATNNYPSLHLNDLLMTVLNPYTAIINWMNRIQVVNFCKLSLQLN